MITPVVKVHPNPIPIFLHKLSLDGELTRIDTLGGDEEILLGMKDGASGKLGLILGIELKLGSLIEIEVGIEVGALDGGDDDVDDGGDDGGDDGNSESDGLEVRVSVHK